MNEKPMTFGLVPKGGRQIRISAEGKPSAKIYTGPRKSLGVK